MNTHKEIKSSPAILIRMPKVMIDKLTDLAYANKMKRSPFIVKALEDLLIKNNS